MSFLASIILCVCVDEAEHEGGREEGVTKNEAGCDKDERRYKEHIGEEVSRLSESRRVEFETSTVCPHEVQVEYERETASSHQKWRNKSPNLWQWKFED